MIHKDRKKSPSRLGAELRVNFHYNLHAMAVKNWLLDSTRLSFLEDPHQPAGGQRGAVKWKRQPRFNLTALQWNMPYSQGGVGWHLFVRATFKVGVEQICIPGSGV